MLVGAVKEHFMEEIEEKYNPDGIQKLYDDYMIGALKGQPIEEIPEVESYMRRHQIDYLIFLDRMAAPNGDCMKLKDDEGCKRDFLRYEIRKKADNSNTVILKKGITTYIKENFLDFIYQ